jgi:hypothetical protein
MVEVCIDPVRHDSKDGSATDDVEKTVNVSQMIRSDFSGREKSD